MFGIENLLYEQLLKLRNEYDVKGIKAEFEAEGSSYRDLVRLRRVTQKAGVGLYLKIGGPEAVRDIRESLDFGVDGLIAPMVESSFGALKFVEAVQKVYKQKPVDLTLNIETVTAVDQLDSIMEYANGKVQNFTIGRTDLSGSYFRTDVTPDSDFIFSVLAGIAKKIQNTSVTMTVGGSLNVNTLKKFELYPDLANSLTKFETRKVMFPMSKVKAGKEALSQAFEFEKLYILSKKELNDLEIETELKRLSELEKRGVEK